MQNKQELPSEILMTKQKQKYTAAQIQGTKTLGLTAGLPC